MTIHLPQGPYEPRTTPLDLAPGGAPLASRTVFSAAHVVADPYADVSPDSPAAVDWDATLAFRRHLWSHGLGVAEAMDTAQRGMGLDWAGAAELIRRSAAEAKSVGGAIACGVGTDQLPARPGHARRGAFRVRGAARPRRGERRPGHPDGLARPRRRGEEPAGLPGHLRASPAPGHRTGRPALARPDVRPGAGRLLGLHRPGRGDGHLPPGHRRTPRQGRRHQDLASRRGARDRRPPPPPERGALLHRGRLQLPRADHAATTAASATPCSASSTRSARWPRTRYGSWTPETPRASANSSTRRSSCPATSSSRPPATTRPAWCSSPGW